jgi:hypothetical protein
MNPFLTYPESLFSNLNLFCMYKWKIFSKFHNDNTLQSKTVTSDMHHTSLTTIQCTKNRKCVHVQHTFLCISWNYKACLLIVISPHPQGNLCNTEPDLSTDLCGSGSRTCSCAVAYRGGWNHVRWPMYLDSRAGRAGAVTWMCGFKI